MSDNHDEDRTGTSGINRRSVLKNLGTTAAIGTAGVGFSGSALASDTGPTVNREETRVSQSTLSDVSRRKESKTVLEKTGVDSFEWDESTSYRITVDTRDESHVFQEVVAQSKNGDVMFDHVWNPDSTDRTASIKTGKDTIYRATVDEDGLRTDHLRLGDRVTEEIVEKLVKGDNKDQLMQNGVSALNTADASAHRDLQTGVDRLFIGTKMDSGEKALLLIEMDQNADLNSALALGMSSGSGMVRTQGAVDCFGACVAGVTASIGYLCYNLACGSCIAVPNPGSCGTCLACAGAPVAACAAGCGAKSILK